MTRQQTMVACAVFSMRASIFTGRIKHCSSLFEHLSNVRLTNSTKETAWHSKPTKCFTIFMAAIHPLILMRQLA